jgi:hypothetical protein
VVLVNCTDQITSAWTIGSGHIECGNLPGYCLASDLPSTLAAMVVLDEFGNGELTTYGPFVQSQCFGVCGKT